MPQCGTPRTHPPSSLGCLKTRQAEMVSSRLLEKRHTGIDSERSSGRLEVHSHCRLCHLQVGQAAKILENSTGTMGSVTASCPLTVEASSSGKWEGAVAAQRADPSLLRRGGHPAPEIDSLQRESSEWRARNTPTLLVAKPYASALSKAIHELILPQDPERCP